MKSPCSPAIQSLKRDLELRRTALAIALFVASLIAVTLAAAVKVTSFEAALRGFPELRR